MTAKPAAGILDTAHSLYATPLRFICGFCETTGKFSMGQHANVTGLPDVPGIPYPGAAGKALGPVPSIINDDATFGPARRFGFGSSALVFPGCGYTAQPTGNIHTWAFVIRLRIARLASLLENACHMVIACNGIGETAFGPAISVSQAGVASLGFWRMGLYNTNMQGQATFTATSNLTLADNEWYAGAITRGTTATTLRLYRYSNTTLISGAGGNAASADGTLLFENPAPTAGAVVVNPWPDLTALNGVNNQIPFLGDLSCLALYDATFDDTAFLNFYTDPFEGIRAVSNGVAAGTLVAGQSAVYAEPDAIYFTASDPQAKDQAATYQLHSLETPSASPAAGNAISGATTRAVTISNPGSKTAKRYYAQRQSDSSETVTTFSGLSTYGHPGIKAPKDILGILPVGDSHSSINSLMRFFGAELSARDYMAKIAHASPYSGAAAYHTTVGLSWQPSAIQGSTVLMDRALLMAAADSLDIAMVCLGVNDAGSGLQTDAATFYTKMQNVIAALLAGGIRKVILNVPPPRNDVAAYAATLQTYTDVYYSLCNGNSIVMGDVSTAKLGGIGFWRHDNLHLTRAGYQRMAANWADALTFRKTSTSLRLS
jgi:lysophospholipase L1-like esterase